MLVRRGVEQRGVGGHLPRHERREGSEEDEEHDDDHEGLAGFVPVLEASRRRSHARERLPNGDGGASGRRRVMTVFPTTVDAVELA